METPQLRGRASPCSREAKWTREKIIFQDKVQYHIEVLPWKGFCEQQRLSQFHNGLLMLCLSGVLPSDRKQNCALGSGSEGGCRNSWGQRTVMDLGRAPDPHVVLWRQGWAQPQIEGDIWVVLTRHWVLPTTEQVQMLCRGVLCLQFTCFTAFPRAGLASSPEGEQDCGGYSFLPWCLFLLGMFAMHTFSIPVCLERWQTVGTNHLKQFHPCHPLQGCKAALITRYYWV